MFLFWRFWFCSQFLEDGSGGSGSAFGFWKSGLGASGSALGIAGKTVPAVPVPVQVVSHPEIVTRPCYHNLISRPAIAGEGFKEELYDQARYELLKFCLFLASFLAPNNKSI